ncbi:hypothetical protein SBA1_1570001 [Candidatus Sulfotelmatobacter kueseliae]|uniref:Uncharacterized protein n=1 Tax=Candidatus Sulfotelmatobacter kueseliae TaxID=2042962 RepID=A0A2U3KA53_9BACT|nr:hypothetical protein SBA1_1570001 [Candidatus Sulfotelmatobacter kueseliae]
MVLRPLQIEFFRNLLERLQSSKPPSDRSQTAAQLTVREIIRTRAACQAGAVSEFAFSYHGVTESRRKP